MYIDIKMRSVKLSYIIFGILFLVLSASIVFAAHIVLTSDGGTSFNFNEDTSNLYNFTVNNTDILLASNISQVNLTLPASFTFIANTNGTDAGTHTFVNTSSVLSWENSAGIVLNLTLNHFSFNATASTPGTFNLTVTTLNSTGTFTSNLSVTVNDTTLPSSIDFVSPSESNGANLSQSNVVVNVTATDNGVIDTVLVRLYNSTDDQINSSSSSTSPLFINFTGLADGTYKFNATVNDTAGLVNNTVTRTVILDTGNPSIEFVSPTESNSSTISRSNIAVNITASDSGTGIDTITVRLYNSTDDEINSSTSSTSPLFIDFTGLSDGTYKFNATVNDTVGKVNNTLTRTVTIDTTPAPTTSSGSGSSIVGGGNIGAIPSAGFTLTMYQGTRITVKVKGIDHKVMVDNVGTNSATLTISSTPTTITLLVGETKTIDTDNNGLDDFSIELLTKSKYSNSIKLLLKEIEEVVVVEPEVKEKVIEEPKKELIEEVIKETKPQTLNRNALITILVLVILGLGIWHYLVKRK